MSGASLFHEITDGGWSVLQRWKEDHVSESLHLEFKTRDGSVPDGKLSPGDRATLAKAVSGFANIDGGLYVLGVDARWNTKIERDCMVDLVPLARVGSLAQEVERWSRELVTPVVPALDVQIVPTPDDTDRGVVVLRVPASDVGPHRVTGTNLPGFDERYYMRSASSTIVIPHPVLSAMFGRVPSPRLKLRLVGTSDNKVRVFVENHGRGVARAVSVRIEFMKNEHDNLGIPSIEEQGSLWYRFDRLQADGRRPMAYRKDPQEPLFPGDAEQVIVVTLQRPAVASDFVRVRLDAEGAVPARFRGPLPLDGGVCVMPDDYRE